MCALLQNLSNDVKKLHELSAVFPPVHAHESTSQLDESDFDIGGRRYLGDLGA